MADRCRGWCLTVNNPEKTDSEMKDYLNTMGLEYCIFQRERGEKGTEHLQMYLEFNNAHGFASVKKAFPTAHIEARKGTKTQARDYCKKTPTSIGEPVEVGEFKPENQGSRSDLDNIAQLIKDGTSMQEIAELYPSQYIKYSKHFKEFQQDIYQNKYRMEFRKMDVVYIGGISGIGKTRFVMEKHGFDKVYHVQDYAHPFDGYQGEDVMLFDEFRSSLPFQQMLNYLDGYPCQLSGRFYQRYACYHTVYVLSNERFGEQYRNIQQYLTEHDYKAFQRRFNRVYWINDEKDYKHMIENERVQDIIKQDVANVPDITELQDIVEYLN
jgi:hypothetical protein